MPAIVLLANAPELERTLARSLMAVRPCTSLDTATSAAEAAALLVGSRVDALFVDRHLLGHDTGLAFASRVRRLQLPVPIAIIGAANDEIETLRRIAIAN